MFYHFDKLWLIFNFSQTHPNPNPPRSTYFLHSTVQKSMPKPKARARTKSQNPIKDSWPYPNQNQEVNPQLGTFMPHKAPNQDVKDMDVLCTFIIKIESQKFEYRCTKDQWQYPNEYQDAKPQSGTSSVLQSPKWGLKGHGCSLHLQNQDREPKFGSWVYQRPVTISKSRSRCQTPISYLHHLPNIQIRT